jgi:dolichol-phosphate mannosyltransferase
MQIVLTLPAYNEEQGLPELFAAFQREILEAGHRGRIVIVDDGSADGTAEVIRRWSSLLPIDMIRHAENRGLGETIEDALRRAAALAAPDDAIVTMDADNTHSPSAIPQMVSRLREGCDVVISSRYRPGSRVTGLGFLRRALSYQARLLFQLLYPICGVRDYTSGFRAYRAAMLQKAFARAGGRLLREKGFAATPEILLRLRQMGASMAEVPMELHYERKAGAGKMRIGRTVIRTLLLLARCRFTA